VKFVLQPLFYGQLKKNNTKCQQNRRINKDYKKLGSTLGTTILRPAAETLDFYASLDVLLNVGFERDCRLVYACLSLSTQVMSCFLLMAFIAFIFLLISYSLY
jgi:hypothetical protein